MQNNNKLNENDVEKVWVKKSSHLGLIFNISEFLCQKL